ncbi:ABC transporter permease subunit [[Clostridium] spiroforme]|nr:ABC transporter permease subunit [Thomasclavelia spiroformis]MBM6880091.1 ABC transporter permease subunit [Thomasclavelia spiroformis]
MLKRELQINLKSFLIWLFVLLAIFLVVFAVYPSLISSDGFEKIDEFMKMFPDDVLAAFNMDITSISTAYGWLKSEGMTFILLISGCYAGLLGSQIILKEENDKTIEYLYSLPVTRNQIIRAKVITGMIYITLLVIGSALFNYIALILQQKINLGQYLILSLTPLLTSYIFYFVCLMISTFTHKTRKVTGLALALVVIAYFLQIVSTISNQVEFLKYFSVFTLADTRNIIIQNSIDPVNIILTAFICIICFVITLWHYNIKELI